MPAQTLATAFSNAGLTVGSVSSRHGSNRDALRARVPAVRVTAEAQDVVDDSDFVFLSVSDDAIGPMCSSLRWRDGQAVVHGSGATEVSALTSAAAAGAHIGGFHPMQMFANPDVALAGLPGCTGRPWCPCSGARWPLCLTVAWLAAWAAAWRGEISERYRNT